MESPEILIVDNDRLFLDLMCELLENAGFRIRTAKDGKEALDAIKTYSPDILFTDLVMPKISGEQLIRYIREDPALKHTIIVVVSAAIVEYNKYEEIHADYFVAKCDIKLFSQKIEILSRILKEKQHSIHRSFLIEKSVHSRKIVQELMTSRNAVLKIMNSVKAGILVCDPDHMVLDANHAAETLLDIAFSQVLGAKIENLFPEADRKAVDEGVQQSFDGKAQLSELNTKIGNKFIEIHFSCIDDPSEGRSPCGLILLYDISHQKEIESRLEKRVFELDRINRRIEKLQGYLESAAQVASLLLKPGELNEKIDHILEMMGKAADAGRASMFLLETGVSNDMLFKRISDWWNPAVLPDEIREEWRDQSEPDFPVEWIQLLASDRIVTGANTNFSHQTATWMNHRGAKGILMIPLVIQGDLMGIVVFDNRLDDTPWPQAEVNLLRQTADSLASAVEFEKTRQDKTRLMHHLQHSERMKFLGEISAGLSHNFRNILAGIMANCELLQLKHSGDESIQKSVNAILNLSRSGSDLIGGLLKFSRKPVNRDKRIVNLAEILDDNYRIMMSSFPRNITIQKKWPASLITDGDAAELSQIFMNILINARDAMPDGGELRIEARTDDQHIRIQITDDGCGMDEETARRIFDPFFTTKDPGKGVGLGMSTAYGIVHHHGGDIQVFSQPGLGTVFTVILPAMTAKKPEKVVPEPAATPGNEQHILIIDDDSILLTSLKDLLTEYGYHVTIQTSGLNAVERYQSSHVDVVLLDRNMPGMDGTTLAKNILSMDQNAKIILMSGYDPDGPEKMDQDLRQQIRGYLLKPFSISRLTHLLAEVCPS